MQLTKYFRTFAKNSADHIVHYHISHPETTHITVAAGTYSNIARNLWAIGSNYTRSVAGHHYRVSLPENGCIKITYYRITPLLTKSFVLSPIEGSSEVINDCHVYGYTIA